MATSCAPQPGCSPAPADLRRISANNTPPRPSQSLWACHPNSRNSSKSLHRPVRILYNATHGCFLDSNPRILCIRRFARGQAPVVQSTISVDLNDANLDGTFAAGERTGSVEYLIDNSNFTGYQQTILETVKNAEGQATKRITYTFGLDAITQNTTLPLPGGGEGWGERPSSK
jgi:hypothetical protein